MLLKPVLFVQGLVEKNFRVYFKLSICYLYTFGDQSHTKLLCYTQNESSYNEF